MLIKDVERAAGMTRDNIRFYEKEGLIFPARSDTNNYREYKEADVEQLRKIKLLRTIGISIPDIRRLMGHQEELPELLEKRMEEIKSEQKELLDILDLCNYIKEERMEFDTLDTGILEYKEDVLHDKIAAALREDITEIFISGDKFNNIVGAMLTYGFVVNVVISWLAGSYFVGKTAFAIVYMVISVAGGIMVFLSAKPWFHLIIFHMMMLTLAPAVISCVPLASSIFPGFPDAAQFTLFFIMTAGYVLVMWLLIHVWKRYFTKVRYVVASGLLYAAAGIGLYYMLYGGAVLLPALFFLGMTMYLSLGWVLAYIDRGNENCNLYYAVLTATRLMGVFITIISVRADKTSSWGRGERL